MRFLLLIVVFLQLSYELQAQKVRIVTSDIVFGSATGALLASGGMAVTRSYNEDALRYGVGFGILGGVGLSVYDVVQAQGEDDYFVKGMLAEGNSTGKIIFMDTIYGAGLGMVVASAVSLIAKKSFVNSLAYGYSIGLWSGFGAGLVDAFLFSDTSDFPFYEDLGDDFYTALPTPGTIEIGTPSLTLTRTGFQEFSPTMKISSIAFHF